MKPIIQYNTINSNYSDNNNIKLSYILSRKEINYESQYSRYFFNKDLNVLKIGKAHTETGKEFQHYSAQTQRPLFYHCHYAGVQNTHILLQIVAR